MTRDGRAILEVGSAVAQLTGSRTRTLRTPLPESADSDDVVLALATARALEARGDIEEAAKWLRRAASEAEHHGDDARVLVFAHVAADLTSTVSQSPRIPAPPRGRREEPSEPTIPELQFASGIPGSKTAESTASARNPSRSTIPEDDESSVPTLVPPGHASRMAPPAPAPPIARSISLECHLAVSLDQPVAERTIRVAAIRVAIKKTSANASATAKSFSVERLASGQEAPVGAVEAVLVIADADDD